MSLGDVAGVALAGAVGAPARYLLDGYISDRMAPPLPRGTIVVNISGSFLLGLLTGLGLYHGLARTPRLVLGTGFCGAYTTFSTFSFQTARLGEEKEVRAAALNVALSVVLSTAAAALGLWLAAVAP